MRHSVFIFSCKTFLCKKIVVVVVVVIEKSPPSPNTIYGHILNAPLKGSVKLDEYSDLG